MHRVEIRLPTEALRSLDGVRGRLPRATWIAALVERELGTLDPALERALGDPGALDQEAGGITKAAVSGVVSGSHPGPSSDRASGGPALIPGVVRASDLVREPEPDGDPFAEDEWPPREAREW